MQTIFHKWNCWGVASNARYIAAFGDGITILDRLTLEPVHHFTGIWYILGGYFLNEDMLVTFTSEQRIFFFQISGKKLFWECPRPNELASSGDIRWVPLPDAEKVVCIAAGRQSPYDHFYLLVDYVHRTVHIQKIPNCYSVVRSIVHIPPIGLVCLSYEASGNGDIRYKMTSLQEEGTFLTLCNWNSSQIVNFYSGSYLFMNDYTNQTPALRKYKLKLAPDHRSAEWEASSPLPFPTVRIHGPVGTRRMVLPSISWVNEEAGLLIANSSDWIGVFDVLNEHPAAEYEARNISCGAIIDGNLLIGCTPGLYLEKLINFK